MTVVEDTGGEVPPESELTDLQETETYETVASEPETGLGTETGTFGSETGDVSQETETVATEAGLLDEETELATETAELLAGELLIEDMETVEDPELLIEDMETVEDPELLSYVSLEIPENATPLVAGKTVTAEFGAGEPVWYSYKPGTTANYIIQSTSFTTNPKVWLYQEMSGQLGPLDANDDGGSHAIGNFYLSTVLEAGVQYYYAVGSSSGEQAGSCTFSFAKKTSPYAEKLVSVTQPDATSFTAKADPISYCLSGMKLSVKYSNGYSGEIDASVGSDYYDNQISKRLYEKTADGQKGDEVAVDSPDLSGTYIVEVSCGAVVAATELTFQSLSEAAGETVLTEDLPLELTLGSNGAAWFIPEETGSYYFCMPGFTTGNNYLNIYTEDGTAVSFANTSIGEKVSLEAGARYIAAYRIDLSPETTELSVKKVSEFQSFALGSDARTVISSVELSDVLGNYPITVTYDDHTEQTVAGETQSGDKFFVYMYDTNGYTVYYSDRSTPVQPGTYVLDIMHWATHSSSIKQEVTVTADAPEGTVKLKKGVTDSRDVSLAEGEYVYYEFIPEQTGSYVVNLTTSGLNIYDKYLYVIDTSTGEITRDSSFFEGRPCSMTAGKRYILKCKVAWLVGDEPAQHISVKVSQMPDATILFGDDAPSSIPVSSLQEELKKYPVYVKYTDRTEQIIWDTTSTYPLGSTASGDQFELALRDSDGNYQEEYCNAALERGYYTIEVYFPDDSTRTLAAEKEIRITYDSPESAVTLSEGETSTAEITLAAGQSANVYFAFTPTTSAMYNWEYNVSGFPNGSCEALYQETNWSACVSLYENVDEFSSMYLSDKGVFVFHVEADPEKAVSGTVSMKIEKGVQVTGLTIPKYLDYYSTAGQEISHKFQVTVSFDNGKQTKVTEWHPVMRYGVRYFYSVLENNEYIYLSLYDNEDNSVNIPDGSDDTVLTTGTYRLDVETNSQYTESKIRVNTMSGSSGTVPVGGSADYVLYGGGWTRCYELHPDADGRYLLRFSNGLTPYDGTYGMLYRKNGDQVEYMSDVYAVTTVELQKDETYYLYLQNCGSETVSGNLCFQHKNMISTMSLSAGESYSAFDFAYSLETPIAVRTVYANGDAETIDSFGTQYVKELGIECWTETTENGDTIYVWLENSEGEAVKKPEVYEDTSFVPGTYTLRARVGSGEDALSDSQSIVITGSPANYNELPVNTSSQYSWENETDYYLLDAEKVTGSYVITNTGSGASLWSLTDTELVKMEYSGSGSITVKGGCKYVVWVSADEITGGGTLSFTWKRDVSSVSLTADAEYSAFGAGETLAELPLVVTYDNKADDTDTLTEWQPSAISDSLGSHIEGQVMTTGGDTFRLRMETTEGEAVSLPVSAADPVPVGTYQLKVYNTATPETILDSKTVTFTGIPETAVNLVSGESTPYHVEDGDTGYYYFTADTAEKYGINITLEEIEDTWNADLYQTGGKTAKLVMDDVWIGNRTLNAEAGMTYVLVLRPEAEVYKGTVLVVKALDIVGIRIAEEPELTKYIEGLDRWLDTEGMRAEVTYDGETWVALEIGETDIYGNCLVTGLYNKEETETPDQENEISFGLSTEAGIYYLAVKTEDGDGSVYAQIPVTVLTKTEAAAAHVLTDEAASLALEGQKEYYLCASYTPQKSGVHSFVTERALSDMKVFTSDEVPVSVTESSEYKHNADLLAGQTYILALKMSNTQSTLSVETANRITSVAAGTTQPGLIAGVDGLDENDFFVTLSYEDETKVTLRGAESDSAGNAFRYEVKAADGTLADTDYPEAGSYQVQAVHCTDDSIKAANTFTVEVKGLDVDALTELTEDEELVLAASGSRRFFSFTPQHTGSYELTAEKGTSYFFYQPGSAKLEQAGEYLTAGTQYVVMIEKISTQQSVIMTYLDGNTGTSLNVGEEETFGFGADTQKEFVFTAAAAGSYVILADCLDAAEAHRLELSIRSVSGTNLVSGTKNGQVSYTFQANAGETYRISLSKHNVTEDADTVCQDHQIIVVPVEDKIPQSISAKPKAGVTSVPVAAAFAEKIDLNDYLDVEVTYKDTTTEPVLVGQEDRYGHAVGYYSGDPEEDGEKLKITFELYCGDSEVTSVSLYAEIDTDNLSELELETENSVATGAGKWDFYKLTVPETDVYCFQIAGIDGYDLYISSGNTNCKSIDNAKARLRENTEYLLGVKRYSETVGVPYTICMKKAKTVQAVTILTNPKVVIPGTTGEGMTAKVTYSDGDTATVTPETEMDEYGNSISCMAEKLTADKTRVYLICGGYQTYCDVENTASEELSQATTEERQEITADAAGYTTEYFVFKPQSDGSYECSAESETGASFRGAVVYDPETDTYDYFPASLKAGRSYIISVSVYFETAGTAQSFQVTSLGETLCANGHQMVVTGGIPATCGKDGTEISTCSICGYTKTKTLPATGDHNWTTIVDTAPTCEKAGSQHRECTVCGTKEEATVLPARGHNWQTKVDKAATCGATGSQHEECSTCHQKRNTTTIPATGRHTYGAYVTTKAATALAEGTMTHKCTVCGHSESKSIPKLTPTITMNATSIKLKTKQSTTKLTVSGLAAGDYVESWKSSNTKIVKVTNSGKVTAQKKTGKAVLTVTLASGKTAKVNVTVQSAAVKTTKISGLSKKLTLARGKKTTLKPVVTPITSVEKVTYTTSNKKVATVSSKGVIAAKASGTAKITVKAGSKKFVVTVTVPKTATTAIKSVPVTATVKKGKTLTLKPKLTPSRSEDKITYTSSNKKVATVTAKGKITGKKKGTAVITVKSGKIKVKCTVTVK